MVKSYYPKEQWKQSNGNNAIRKSYYAKEQLGILAVSKHSTTVAHPA